VWKVAQVPSPGKEIEVRRTKKIGWGKNSVHLRRPRFTGAPTRQQVLDQKRERLQEEEIPAGWAMYDSSI
jgi:hypothetical protein